MSLQNSVAVVTGGTRGVGRGIAGELARQGARVFVTGRSRCRITSRSTNR
jgi:NAD(P)-dependent dehydrogenase (short-subunit alcohol dehydrogenase family)